MTDVFPILEGPEPGAPDEGRGLTTVRLGFIPLTDCAVLAVARERGFAANEGIDLRLSREVSWANIRDKVALGHLQGAQMLAGMPIAAAFGVNQVPQPMVAPFCLSRNGNGITVSQLLYGEMAAHRDLRPADGAAAAGKALRRVIETRRAAGHPPLTFGMVYPFSCHNYELRYWMASCGIDPEQDVRLVAIPPPLMVDSLRAGHVDGFCVGEPWNSLAVDAGLGRIVVSKAELWRRGMEKVLAVPAGWAIEHAGVLAALVRALDHAAAWAEDPAHRTELAALLALPQYLNLPAQLIERALSGAMIAGPGEAPHAVPDFLVLHGGNANEPSVTDAFWIYSQMIRWGQVVRRPGDEAVLRTIFNADLYRSILADPSGRSELNPPTVNPDTAGETSFFDGRPFDPEAIDRYLADLT